MIFNLISQILTPIYMFLLRKKDGNVIINDVKHIYIFFYILQSELPHHYCFSSMQAKVFDVYVAPYSFYTYLFSLFGTFRRTEQPIVINTYV